jgi:hypothetical protein
LGIWAVELAAVAAGLLVLLVLLVVTVHQDQLDLHLSRQTHRCHRQW